MGGIFGREPGLKGCGQVVTVWNRRRNPESGREEFVRHIIPVLCKWRCSTRRGESRAASHIAAASVSQSLTVVVPYSESYRSYDVWARLSDEDRKRYFTLHVSDLIALGSHETDITGLSPYTETEVKKLLGDNCATISTFADNSNRGLRRGGHYKVGCFYGFRNMR